MSILCLCQCPPRRHACSTGVARHCAGSNCAFRNRAYVQLAGVHPKPSVLDRDDVFSGRKGAPVHDHAPRQSVELTQARHRRLRAAAARRALSASGRATDRASRMRPRAASATHCRFERPNQQSPQLCRGAYIFPKRAGAGHDRSVHGLSAARGPSAFLAALLAVLITFITAALVRSAMIECPGERGDRPKRRR